MNLKTSTPFQKLKDALELFKKGGRYNIDLSDYLKRFLKNSVKENLIKKILRLVRMAHSRYDIYVYFHDYHIFYLVFQDSKTQDIFFNFFIAVRDVL